jgi:hypothetical protein
VPARPNYTILLTRHGAAAHDGGRTAAGQSLPCLGRERRAPAKCPDSVFSPHDPWRSIAFIRPITACKGANNFSRSAQYGR